LRRISYVTEQLLDSQDGLWSSKSVSKDVIYTDPLLFVLHHARVSLLYFTTVLGNISQTYNFKYVGRTASHVFMKVSVG